MHADLFDMLLRAAIVSSGAILLVLALRDPVRRAFGSRVAYSFWLLAPVITIAGLLPARRMQAAPAPQTQGAPDATTLVAGPVGGDLAAIGAGIAEAQAAIDIGAALVAIWAAGALASLVVLLIGQTRFLARLRLRPASGDRRFCIADDRTVGPAVIGVFRPRIMLPADFDTRYTPLERALVIEHERSHLASFDAQVNALAALALCLNWYNPLYYAARAALRIDQELACDERVMTRHGAARRTYAEAMLKTQLAARAAPLGCYWPPLGAPALKSRIAMLARPAKAPFRRGVGAGLFLATALSASVAAWAAQPPRPALDDRMEADRAGVFDFRGHRLVEAILEGDRALAFALIEAGADVDYFLPGDGTPLVVAAQQGDDEIARALLDAGADINKPAPGDGNPLIVASMNGDMSLVRLFIAAGADVNGYVRADETPLINAAREGHLDVAEHLINEGADVNLEVDAPTTRGRELRSPLGMARQMGHDAMVQLLRDRGARG